MDETIVHSCSTLNDIIRQAASITPRAPRYGPLDDPTAY